MGIKGLGFDEEYQRYYPEASLAAHLVGFVGKDKDGGDVGYFGVEGYYDKDLKGLSGLVKTERDVFGRPILIGTQEKLSSENGRDVLLTVDKPVQEIVKSKLKAGVEKYGAKDGCVIVANPKTMEILALSCLPDFDADKYYNFSQDHFKNPAISNVYEPGSTFKPLIVASAIEQKAIKPDDQYNETGPVQVGEYSIKTWNNQYGGRSTITNILERSSNVGMVYIGQKMGNDKVYQAIDRLGFGKATNIDLQGEVASYLKDREDWYPIDYATVTFGQGIAVTPIQMITAFSAVINGGILMQPYVTYATIDNGKETYRKPQPIRRVFSQRTSNIMKQMLYSTVEHGEFKWAKPEGYKIGGKTGTAQIAIGGGYHESKTVASFIGFAPVDDPQFIAIVILTEPTTSQWGSETAAPLFFDIAKELLVYYNIPPDS
jgi:cell division protein FtsI/penicillin-binding protein 2